jgi:hypothetical protein
MFIFFAQNPMWYIIPTVVTMILLVAGARLVPHLYKGDLKLLRHPGLLLPLSLLWFVFYPFVVGAIIMWMGEKFFKKIVPNDMDE